VKSRLFVSVEAPIPAATISPLLHGQFAEHLGACIYDGVWRNGSFNEAVVEALAELRPPVLRWPGGCFADDYHWRDGIGPKDRRPRTVNIHWRYAVEDNSFGTHEFVELCRRIGAQPYFAGNVGSGTVQEFRNWIEYCNFAGDSTLAQERAANGSPDPFGIAWWGVGNENWACGGNFCPEDYAVEFKRYTTYLRDYPGAPLKLIACGPDSDNADWTRRFFGKLGSYTRSGRIHGYAAHFYTADWGGAMGASTGFSDEQFYKMLAHSRKIESLILHQRAIMDGWDPDRKIGLIIDEWGTWHHPADTPPATNYVLYQQNAIRDALVAAMTLDIFHNQADKVVMANIAQAVNVLQAMLLTDAAGRVVKTPTFHVFDLYRAHQGGTLLTTHFESENAADGLPTISGSASRQGDHLILSLVNASLSETVEVALNLVGASVADARYRVLAGEDVRSHNTFDRPDAVKPAGGELSDFSHITLPPASVTVVKARLSA